MKPLNKDFWKKIVYFAAIFAIFISILLIINYIQYSKLDPVNAKLIENLVQRLNEDPNNEALREEIRTIDLLSRKAYFTSQWQIKMGGYLLLLTVILLVIAMQMTLFGKKEVEFLEKEDTFFAQAKARKWIIYSAIGILFVGFISAFLSHQQLNNNFLAENTNFSKTKKEEKENNFKTELADEELADSAFSDTITVQTDSLNIKLSPFPTNKEIAENYPNFRGIGGNGIIYKKNIPTKWNGQTNQNILWKVKIPLQGYNSPIIWGNFVFVSGANDSKREIYCYEINTGKLIWKHQVKISGSPSTSPKVTPDTGHAAPSLATDGRRVYAIFSNGDILAVDMNGNQIWGRNLGVLGNHYGHSSSLILFQDKVIVQYDQKQEAKVMALNTLTGKTIWNTPRKVKISWASPIVVNTGKQTEIILAADPFIASYNPYTGKENWKIDCIFGEVGPSPAYADGIVFATNEYANLSALKLGEKPEILWQSDEYMSEVPSPIATKDYLFLVTSYGLVACYGAKDGKKLWEHEFSNGFYGSPMLVNNSIYLIDIKGITHIFRASDKFNLIASNPLGENSTCTPAFSDGKILIRGKENLYCFGK